jgi:mxaA protein
MKKILRPLLATLSIALLFGHAYALETDFLPDVKNGVVSIKIKEPERDVGYTVGDILTREITVTVKKPYVLVEESLPIVGYERRYKGQLIGIDLTKLDYSKKSGKEANTHHISLSYQVFTNNVVAKPAALPGEYLRILDTSSKDKKVYRYRIPSWNFAISPISVFGQVKVESDMSGYRGPLLLDASRLQTRLNVLLAVLAVALLGLLYMLGKHTWLPRMGGPFAKAYRSITKSQRNAEGMQLAVSRLHDALNTSAGYSLFSNNFHAFLLKKPAFQHIQAELGQFFDLSRQVFFEPSTSQAMGEPELAWLAQFCKQCRDCERGLIPDSISTTRKAA